jgi:hypothetical protein
MNRIFTQVIGGIRSVIGLNMEWLEMVARVVDTLRFQTKTIRATGLIITDLRCRVSHSRRSCVMNKSLQGITEAATGGRKAARKKYKSIKLYSSNITY